METLYDLMKDIFNILPNAEFGEDNDGQIIIYTNKTILVNESVSATEAKLTDFEVRD